MQTNILFSQRPENYNHYLHDLQRAKHSYKDSSKYFIGFDVLKACIDEPSLTVGYNITNRHSITFSLGYTYRNQILRPLVVGISPSQDTDPILPYNGPTLRTGYNFRIISFLRVGADFFYKDLYYNNVDFYDSEGDQGDLRYTRSEKAQAFGWHINSGLMINLSKVFYFNPSLAMGQTFKHRTYTTSNVTEYRMTPVPEGTFSKEQKYFSMMLSANFGVKFGQLKNHH
jgi:hypothetical protein